MSNVSPFEFVNSINNSKENLFVTKGYTDSDYNKFIVNRNFSYFQDTVHIANVANQWLNSAPAKSHFEFYLHLVDRRKRFSKWARPQVSDDLKMIMKFYNYSNEKAAEVLPLFSTEELEAMRKMYNSIGGKDK